MPVGELDISPTSKCRKMALSVLSRKYVYHSESRSTVNSIRDEIQYYSCRFLSRHPRERNAQSGDMSQAEAKLDLDPATTRCLY